MREALFIGLNVFRQLLRNRILVVLLLFALSLIGLALVLGDLGQEADLRLSRDFGLLTLQGIGFFTVLLCHVVLLFEESELRTVALLLVKPIARWQYLTGKILGSVFLTAFMQGCMLLLLLGLAAWRGQDVFDPSFLAAALYFFLSFILFSVVTGFFAVFASSVPACAVFATFAYGLGSFTTNLLEWVSRMDKPLLKAAVQALYFVMPNFSLFNLRENLAGLLPGAELGWGPYLWPLAYGSLYGGFILSLSIWRYARKEY